MDGGVQWWIYYLSRDTLTDFISQHIEMSRQHLAYHTCDFWGLIREHRSISSGFTFLEPVGKCRSKGLRYGAVNFMENVREHQMYGGEEFRELMKTLVESYQWWKEKEQSKKGIQVDTACVKQHSKNRWGKVSKMCFCSPCLEDSWTLNTEVP